MERPVDRDCDLGVEERHMELLADTDCGPAEVVGHSQLEVRRMVVAEDIRRRAVGYTVGRT